MRRLILVACLLATICAFHIKNHDFNVVIESIEYRNVPATYKLDKSGLVFSKEVLAPSVDIFKKITEDLKTQPRAGTETILNKLLKKIVEDLKIQPRAGTEAILNDYADKIFSNLDSLMIHDGLDPLQMPDEHTGFNYTLIITYYGELDLTHGWLMDLSTVKRGGDVIAEYSTSDKYLDVTVPIAFDDLQFTYDYSATILGLGPSGAIAGKVVDIGVEVKIGFNTQTLEFSLDEFYITNSGRIDFEFEGNPLIDWLLNLLTDVITTLLKEVILLVVEGIIRDGLGGAIDSINSAIHGFLNPTTPVPETTPAVLFLQ